MITRESIDAIKINESTKRKRKVFELTLEPFFILNIRTTWNQRKILKFELTRGYDPMAKLIHLD